MRRSLAIVIAVPLALAVAAGTAVVRLRHRHASGSVTQAVASPSLAPLQTDQIDVDGARLAAIDAVQATGPVVSAGPLTRRDLIDALATARFAPLLVGRTNDLVRGLELGPGVASVTAIERPITAHAEAGSDDVVVNVWSVFVVAASRTLPAREVWHTVTLAMRREAGRWLVDDWQSTPGPSPTGSMEAGASGYDAVTEVAGWPLARDAVVTGASR